MFNTHQKKELQTKVEQFCALLDQNILNSDLYCYAIDHIEECMGQKSLKINVTDQSFNGNHQSGVPYFSIALEPRVIDVQKIIMHSYNGEGALSEIKEIAFIDEHKISVTEQNWNCTVEEKTGTLSYINKLNKFSLYKDNQLVYAYKLEQQTDANIMAQRSYSTVEEFFVTKDEVPFKAIATLAEDNAFPSTSVDYYKAVDYDIENYDTKVNNKGVYLCLLKHVDKEEFCAAKEQTMNSKDLLYCKNMI